MSGQEFPDELPPGYRSRYGGDQLHDAQPPQLDPRLRRQAQQQARAVVERFKEIHC
jgi:hypothetical protein